MTVIDTSLEATLLNRLTFGVQPGDIDRARAQGAKAWLEAQLTAPAGDDLATRMALASAVLAIDYQVDGKPFHEDRALGSLGLGLEALWPLHDHAANPVWQERVRPAQEVRAATWLRAVDARAQLREVMVQFWHNHFSINAFGDDRSAGTFPVFDRDVIRAHALGDFRKMLGAVAKSAAMMFFLNQEASAKAHPNENFAREVMELHTLGIGAYGGRSGSVADGYTDDDVLAAARVLTGWTIANGARADSAGQKPNTGAFLFAPGMHDSAKVAVLGVSLGGGLEGGEALLDRLAAMPATARFICAKLCRRLIGEQASAAVIAAAAAVWTRGVGAPTQIADVVRTIVLHPDFAASAGARVKDPFRLLVSALRVLTVAGVSWQVKPALANLVATMGYRQFEWPTPDGMPDTAATWIGTGAMLNRWNGLTALLAPGTGVLTSDLADATPAHLTTPAGVLAHWSDMFLGASVSETSRAALADFVQRPEALGKPAVWAKRSTFEPALRRLVATIIAMPEFQLH